MNCLVQKPTDSAFECRARWRHCARVSNGVDCFCIISCAKDEVTTACVNESLSHLEVVLGFERLHERSLHPAITLMTRDVNFLF